MRIKKILSQHRRDFTAILKCEGCGHEGNLNTGYDDRNYHDNVIPKLKCPKCGKSREDLGVKGKFTETKYPDDMTV